MNYILFSKNDNYKKGAKKIQMEAVKQNKKSKIIEINNISDKKLLKNNNNKKVLYFLTNDNSIPAYIKSLKNIKITIINKYFLSKNRPKFSLQQKIKKYGICVPKSILIYNIKKNVYNNIQYPFFIKSQKQASLVIYIKNEIDFNKNIKKIKKLNEYYIEKSIENKDFELNKFYYSKGLITSINYMNSTKVPTWIKLILNNIAKSLKLEVFSVDIFINWSTKRYYCIDISPAPAFFKSDIARKNFVKNILI